MAGKISADGKTGVLVELNAETDFVAKNDTFQGAAREFAILFTSAEDSPFDWNRQTGATVTGVVRQGAVKDGQQTDYKYDVQVGDKVLDPKIIVVP